MNHRGQLDDGPLQCFQLDANPTHRELPIHCTMVVDAAKLVTGSEISRLVRTADARQLDEFGLGLFFFFELATGETHTSHQQNTLLSLV